MSSPEVTIAQAYAAFNERDVEQVLSLMSDSVCWAKASEGGSVTGKEEIRDCWRRQWMEFDPIVKPIEITAQPDEKVLVRVHQIVKDISGNLLSNSEVLHRYSSSNGLIEQMEILRDLSTPEMGTTSAFQR